MPDVVQALAVDPKSLELCFRAAGRAISTAALAGCPQESVDHAKRLFNPIGASALEDDAAYLRSRLSSDEIAEAQAAFLEVVGSLEERGEIRIGFEEEFGTDELFIAAFTKAVMTVSPQAIRAVIKSAEGTLIAAAMQGLEPRAHDHILSALPKKEATRILDAIDAADPLPKRAVVGAARELAARLIAASTRGTTSASSIDNLTVVRDWDI
jgi:flagellar motor switch protein FliG